jgi:hypothetical protein
MRTPKNESLPFNIYKKTKICLLNLEFLEVPLYKKKPPIDTGDISIGLFLRKHLSKLKNLSLRQYTTFSINMQLFFFVGTELNY